MSEAAALTIGERLRRLRLAEGLTQKKLSELSGVKQVAISDVERGARRVDLETIHALAVALGHDPHDFDPRLASIEVTVGAAAELLAAFTGRPAPPPAGSASTP